MNALASSTVRRPLDGLDGPDDSSSSSSNQHQHQQGRQRQLDCTDDGGNSSSLSSSSTSYALPATPTAASFRFNVGSGGGIHSQSQSESHQDGDNDDNIVSSQSSTSYSMSMSSSSHNDAKNNHSRDHQNNHANTNHANPLGADSNNTRAQIESSSSSSLPPPSSLTPSQLTPHGGGLSPSSTDSNNNINTSGSDTNNTNNNSNSRSSGKKKKKKKKAIHDDIIIPEEENANRGEASSEEDEIEDDEEGEASEDDFEEDEIEEDDLDEDGEEEDDLDEGQDHAVPDEPPTVPNHETIWKPQNTTSTCEFTHTITNYSQKRESGCKKAEYSNTTIDNYGNKWRLIVYVNGNGRASNHHLSLFLQVADADDLPFGWKKGVSYVLTLEHPSGPTLGYAKRNPDKTFKLCPKAIDWGWSQFITSDRVQQEGYIHDDSLTVRASVTVKSSSISIDPDDAELYLKCAVEEGNAEDVEACLAQGASVNCKFKDDLYTPLHTACSSSTNDGSLDVLKLLLKRGANGNACNKWKETPLLIAANNGHRAAVEALLENGADPSMCSEAGWSALTFAAHKVCHFSLSYFFLEELNLLTLYSYEYLTLFAPYISTTRATMILLLCSSPQVHRSTAESLKTLAHPCTKRVQEVNLGTYPP